MKNLFFTFITILLIVGGAEADWTEKFSLKGDIRLRTEGIDKENSKKRWSQRVRARLQLKADVNPNIKAVLRLASGAAIGSKDNVASTNSTNSGFGANKSFNLDLAYISWSLSDSITFEGGKLKNPLYRVGGSDILWDSDWTPEGGQFIFKQSIANFKIFTNIVGYFLDENKAGEETSLIGGQLGASFGSDIKLTFGGGYYAMNTEGLEPMLGSSGSGNTLYNLSGTELYYNDYRVIEAFLMATFQVLDQPLSIYSNYVNNTEANYERDAFIVGAQFGQIKNIGDFKFDIAFREIKKDAVLGILNDGDFNGGVTDGKGLTAAIKYMVAENSVLGIKYLTSEQGVSTNADASYNRYQIDWAFKF